jgi:hypothetical protein
MANALVKTTGRQEVIAVKQNLNFGTGKELDSLGVVGAIDLPANAIVLDGYLNVVSGTTATATISLGDSGNASRYLAATSVVTVAKTAIANAAGFKTTAPTTLTITIAGAAPVAVGVSEIVIRYIVDGRAAFSQG